MKRTVRPFAVEVRGSRKGVPSWPALSEPAAARSKSPQPISRPALTPQQDEPEAPPAWAGARILPDLTPARLADDEQQLSTVISAEGSPGAQGLEHATTRAKTARKHAKRREEAALKPLERRGTPAKAVKAATQKQDVPAEPSATVGLKIVARMRKTLALASDSAEKLEREAFRRGERWKARLPDAVARRDVKR